MICLSSIITLQASPTNTTPQQQKTVAKKITSATAASKNMMSLQAESKSGSTKTPANSPLLQVQKSENQSQPNTDQKAHHLIVHAVRVLPKKTMISLDQLIQGLPTYIQNPKNKAALSSNDIQILQTSLVKFAQALGQKHPYLAEKSKNTPQLDESAIIFHIQTILKSLPWYIQNPKALSSTIDLHAFSRQLHKIHEQAVLERSKKMQTASTAKKQKTPSDVRIQELIPQLKDLSDDQKDMLEDSDGTPFNETIIAGDPNRTSNNNDVEVQNLFVQAGNLSKVTNKKNHVIGSYERTDTIKNTHMGKFTSIKGEVRFAAEGYPHAPKIDGVGTKAIGYVRDASFAKDHICLYPYQKTNTPKKPKK